MAQTTDEQRLLESLSNYERKLLPLLASDISFDEACKKSGLKPIEAMRGAQWLENKGLLKIESEEAEKVSLDKNGKEYAKEGLPERKMLKALEKGDFTIKDLLQKTKLENTEFNASLGMLKGKMAISLEKGMVAITDQGKKLLQKNTPEEDLLKRLEKSAASISDIKDLEKLALDNLKKRKEMIKIALTKERTLVPTDLGKRLSKKKVSSENVLEKLTPEMLKSGSWKGKSFRRYDVKINVPKIYGGRRHFVNQSIEYIKKIWLEMGFTEMTGTMVQTAFWDLDSLFVPQDHPARDMQDTFYIDDPSCGKLPMPLKNKVKATHEAGGNTGSKGWRYKWDENVAKENLLRTHTTVLSAQAISKLKESDLPAKFFSVNKVYRNETLSWKHLFEFVQVEGIVVDPDANLKHLKGYLKEFYLKMGYKDVRMRPAHFPYTEPSMEVDVLHPVSNTWVELGGSGIFRPEVVEPLLGKAVPVLAWGQGMERIMMSYYKFNDIRQIYNNDLKTLRTVKTWMEGITKIG